MSKLVHLISYTQPTEIYPLVSLLESYGIASFPEEEYGLGLDPFMAQTTVGRWLWVNEEDEKIATELTNSWLNLQNKEREWQVTERKKGYEPIEGWCPKCESTHVFCKTKSTWSSILSALHLASSKLPLHYCGTCGYEWRA